MLTLLYEIIPSGLGKINSFLCIGIEQKKTLNFARDLEWRFSSRFGQMFM
jgi:hypothetical protein